MIQEFVQALGRLYYRITAANRVDSGLIVNLVTHGMSTSHLY